MVDEFEASIAVFSESLTAAEDREDQVEASRFAILLANAYIDANNFNAAEQLLSRALEAAPDSRDPILRARLYWSHSRLHTLQNHPAEAARYARRALTILEATEHTEYTARAHQLLAHIELDRDNPRLPWSSSSTGSSCSAEAATRSTAHCCASKRRAPSSSSASTRQPRRWRWRSRGS